MRRIVTAIASLLCAASPVHAQFHPAGNVAWFVDQAYAGKMEGWG